MLDVEKLGVDLEQGFIDYLKVTIFCGYYCLIFLRFCLKTQNLVLANISYVQYRTLEIVDSVPFLRTNRKI